MDYIREIVNVGDYVLYAVTSAIEHNDYSNLSEELKARFRIFEEDVREDLRMRNERAGSGKTARSGNGYTPGQRTGGRRPGPRVTREVPPFSHKQAPSYNDRPFSRPSGQQAASLRSSKALTPFRPRFFSKGVSIAKMVAGLIGSVCFLPVSIGTFITMLMGDSAGMIAFFTTLPFTAGSLWLTLTGNRKRKLIDLYNHYAELIGPAEYIALEDLSAYAGSSEENVADNIQKLMKSNMLPQGRFDRNQTTLMLTSKAWKQYQAAEKSRMDREAAEQESAYQDEPEDGQQSTVLQEGNEFVKQIHRYNDMIPDEEMSEKLSRLEGIMQRIFRQVEKDPDSAPDLHKLMNYYLPTTEKLILAYIDLDKHPSGSENIDRTRKEIEDAVDTVNEAFEKLFDDLFQDTAWDISSDISVMKNMMRQDGLMKDPMKTQ